MTNGDDYPGLFRPVNFQGLMHEISSVSEKGIRVNHRTGACGYRRVICHWNDSHLSVPKCSVRKREGYGIYFHTTLISNGQCNPV